MSTGLKALVGFLLVALLAVSGYYYFGGFDDPKPQASSEKPREITVDRTPKGNSGGNEGSHDGTTNGGGSASSGGAGGTGSAGGAGGSTGGGSTGSDGSTGGDDTVYQGDPGGVPDDSYGEPPVDGSNTVPGSGGVAVDPGRTGPLNPAGRSGAAPAGASGGSVGSGEYKGGSDMNAGVWHANPGCTYTLNGSSSPLINGGVVLVEIRSGDTFSSPCSWKAGYPSTSSSYGIHVVGKDFASGAYRPSGSECGVSLLSDLRGSNVIAGSELFSTTKETFIFETGDILFTTAGCGSWSKA